MKQLTAEDLVVGKKYVPHSKTPEGYGSLEDSAAWINAKDKGYFYYVGKDDNGHIFWWEMGNSLGEGDYYLPSDVTPYIEPGAGARQYEAPATVSEYETGDSELVEIDPKDFLPFNVEEALKAPERVVYRDGTKPLQWHWFEKSPQNGYCIASTTECGSIESHTSSGKVLPGDTDDMDLFLLPLPKTTYWINVMKSLSRDTLYITGPWGSEDKAFYEITLPDKLVKTITFEI